MVKIIAVTNLKGGVGKTTTSINLAASLGVLEKKVLLIDADPQANTTIGLGIEKIKYGLYQFLTGSCSASHCIITDKNDYLDILPTSLELANLEFGNTNQDSFLLKKKLNKIRQQYDYIIIDSPPSLGTILINIFAACDSILIPVQCEFYAFQGLYKLFSTIQTLKNQINPNIDIEGILITLHNSAMNEHKYITERILEHFKPITFKTIISQNIKLAQASTYGKTILDFDANSSGALNYLKLAEEIINNNTSVGTKNSKEHEIVDSFGSVQNTINNLDFLLNINRKINNTGDPSKTNKYINLIGLNKQELMSKLGQVYNDVNSDIWMYRISEKFNFLKKNYLYIYFENDVVIVYSLKKFKLRNSNDIE